MLKKNEEIHKNAKQDSHSESSFQPASRPDRAGAAAAAAVHCGARVRTAGVHSTGTGSGSTARQQRHSDSAAQPRNCARRRCTAQAAAP